jgi:hypothetical protein
MMKKIITIAALALILPVIALADFDIAKWKNYKEVTDIKPGLNRFVIDDELFSGTRNDLRDLRIIDNENKEVPYKLMTSSATREQKKIYPKHLNNSYDEDGNTSVILDFGENSQGVNRLKINTSNTNFQRNVTLEGSDNSKGDWNTITDKAYIYDYTDKRGGLATQKTEITFSNTIFRYLKLTVRSGSDRFYIGSVNAYDYISEKSKEYIKTPDFTKKRDRLAKTSIVFIDLGTTGVPTKKIQLSITDKNFKRGVGIYSSYDNDKWHSIGSDYVFRYNTDKFKGENLFLNFRETNERYLKLVIYNNDNEELAIDNVKTFSLFREIVFASEVGKEYKVYYDNNSARFPVYDLDSYFHYLDLDKVNDSVLSEEKDNKSFLLPVVREVVEPRSEAIPYLMSVGLVVAALMLLFLVYRFFQK